jgi:hypothetical protein
LLLPKTGGRRAVGRSACEIKGLGAFFCNFCGVFPAFVVISEHYQYVRVKQQIEIEAVWEPSTYYFPQGEINAPAEFRPSATPRA